MEYLLPGCRGGITKRDPLMGECQAKKNKGSLSLIFCCRPVLIQTKRLTRPGHQQKTPIESGPLFFFVCRGGGIRTPGTRKGSPVFKTGAINRSTTPLCAILPFFKDCKSKRKIHSCKTTSDFVLLVAEIRKRLF